MFLTRGVLHHEAAWALWFAAARGLVPAAAVRARGCAPPQLAALRGACGAAAGPRLLQQQCELWQSVQARRSPPRSARNTLLHSS